MTDLFVRADASPATGAGHLMRCAALAEAWLDASLGRVVFWGAVELPFARSRVDRLGATITMDAPDAESDSVLVCDHYGPDVRTTAASAGSFGLRVLVDDLGGTITPGFQMVWNPNAYGNPDLYPGFAGKVLGGIDYIPLRADLPRWQEFNAAGTAVMLGGGHGPPAALSDGIRALDGENSLHPIAGLGSWLPSTWLTLDSDDPWSGIVECERLITAAGITTWEAAATGVPVVLLLVADNQRLIFEWGLEQGVPGISTSGLDAGALGRRLVEACAEARPLPRISNGAARIRDFLRQERATG